jgi:hypothetical protein
LSSCVTFLGFIPGIILGHLARRDLRRHPGLKGRGYSTAGLVFGYFILALVVSGTASILSKPGGWSELVGRSSKKSSQRGAASGRPPPGVFDYAAARDQSGPFPEPKQRRPANPAAGEFGKTSFTYDHAFFDGPKLVLRQGFHRLPDAEISIIPYRDAARLAGQTIKVPSGTGGRMPIIVADWFEDDGQHRAAGEENYEMTLRFGNVTGDKITGSIDLKMSSSPPLSLKGEFTATIKKVPVNWKY